jgi:hypothetical protein
MAGGLHRHALAVGRSALATSGLSSWNSATWETGVAGAGTYRQHGFAIRGPAGPGAAWPRHSGQAAPADAMPRMQTKRPEAAPGSDTSNATSTIHDVSVRVACMVGIPGGFESGDITA